MGDCVYSLTYGTDALEPSSDLPTAAHYARDSTGLFVRGYASQENLDILAGKAFAGIVEMGEGRVVFLVDNPQHRSFLRGSNRTMQDAVMLVPVLVDEWWCRERTTPES